MNKSQQLNQLVRLINQKQEKPIPKSWVEFINKWVETGSITEAALQTFKVKNKNSASARGGYVMRMLGISNEMSAAMAKIGMTRDWRLDKLKKSIENGSDKSLDIAFKLADEYPREPLGGFNINKALFQIQVIEKNPNEGEERSN